MANYHPPIPSFYDKGQPSLLDTYLKRRADKAAAKEKGIQRQREIESDARQASVETRRQTTFDQGQEDRAKAAEEKRKAAAQEQGVAFAGIMKQYTDKFFAGDQTEERAKDIGGRANAAARERFPEMNIPTGAMTIESFKKLRTKVNAWTPSKGG